jgi:hypothetical protein
MVLHGAQVTPLWSLSHDCDIGLEERSDLDLAPCDLRQHSGYATGRKKAPDPKLVGPPLRVTGRNAC